jgi:hypothetical protein
MLCCLLNSSALFTCLMVCNVAEVGFLSNRILAEVLGISLSFIQYIQVYYVLGIKVSVAIPELTNIYN